jgi:hypothetical protein
MRIKLKDININTSIETVRAVDHDLLIIHLDGGIYHLLELL